MNNLITVTDRNGTVTDNTYNALKNLTNVIRHNGSKTATTGYEYNNSGLLKKVFDDETSVEYEYNIKGQTVKIKDALAEQNVTVKEYSYEHVIIGTRKEKPVDTGGSELVPFSFS